MSSGTLAVVPAAISQERHSSNGAGLERVVEEDSSLHEPTQEDRGRVGGESVEATGSRERWRASSQSRSLDPR